MREIICFLNPQDSANKWQPIPCFHHRHHVYLQHYKCINGAESHMATSWTLHKKFEGKAKQHWWTERLTSSRRCCSAPNLFVYTQGTDKCVMITFVYKHIWQNFKIKNSEDISFHHLYIFPVFVQKRKKKFMLKNKYEISARNRLAWHLLNNEISEIRFIGFVWEVQWWSWGERREGEE